MSRLTIISGGSWGADMGALMAGKMLGFPTTGVSHRGALPEYGLTAAVDKSYSARDRMNVDSSEAVVAFKPADPNTGRGTSTTVEYAKNGYSNFVKLQPPPPGSHSYTIKGTKPILILWGYFGSEHATALKQFVTDTNANSLLFCGSIEKNAPGMQEYVKNVLLKAFGGDASFSKPVPAPVAKTVVKKVETNLPHSHYLVMDFEASGHNKDSSSWEIVEFPCVVVESSTMKVVDEFHRYVRPTTVKKLSDFCVEQCGITQKQVDAADPIFIVLDDFIKWVNSKGYASPVVLTCGNYDLRTALKAEVVNKGLSPLPNFLKRWVNIKEVFANHFGCKQVGMAGMLSKLSIPLVGRHHSGIDDARNIAKILIYLSTKTRIPPPVITSSYGLPASESKSAEVSSTPVHVDVSDFQKKKKKNRLQQ
eukprot:TRINITY_DN24493_c0_g1_i1.p1 TRINITY_DN24493_c0_g1~~TRINITY_DN24493_c0_g1_i1.p1  ORF type:complete len:421 (+),score=66.91 TRINITY_DN24493_c0_g1_i1:68-1330(+)